MNELSAFLGGDSVAGAALKSTGTTYWNTPNIGATNSSGFSARAGGILDPWDGFKELGEIGFWWTTTENDSFNSYSFDLRSNNIQLFNGYGAKGYGFCIRCVSDVPLSTIRFEKQIDLNIFPNPASGIITVQNLSEFNSIDLQIVDITGKVLIHKILNNIDTVIDINSLSSGVYFIVANTGENSFTDKLIKK